MATPIYLPRTGPSISESLGVGLGGILQGLAENRLEKMRRTDIAAGLKAAGYSPEEAEALARLPERDRQLVIQQRAVQQKAGTSVDADFRLLSQYLPPAEAERIAQASPQIKGPLIKSIIERGGFAQQPQGLQAGIPAYQPGGQLPGLAPLGPLAGVGQQPAGLEALAGLGQAPTAPQAIAPTEAAQPSLADILGRPYESTTERTARLAREQQAQLHEETQALKREQFERRETRAEQSEINKETQKFYEETNKARKAARENDLRLGRMETLNKEGNLQNPLLYASLKKFHLDIPALQSADSQEFVKLSNDFLRNAKDIFGARLTNLDVQTFLRIVPELSQSPEGRQRIIENMRAFNEASRIRADAQDQIIKANDGKRPRNLESQVEEQSAPALDAIAERFKAGYESKPMKAASDLVSNLAPAPGAKYHNLGEASQLPLGAIIKRKDGKRLQKTETGWKEIS